MNPFNIKDKENLITALNSIKLLTDNFMSNSLTIFEAVLRHNEELNIDDFMVIIFGSLISSYMYSRFHERMNYDLKNEILTAFLSKIALKANDSLQKIELFCTKNTTEN